MKIRALLRKPSYITTTLVVLFSSLLPFLTSGIANAYGLVSTRSITISSASAAASNATTTYTTSFNVATTGVVAGMVVDVCSNDPIIGDSCTAPTGFTWGASPTISGSVTTTGQTGLTWSAASANSGRSLELTTTGTVSGSVSSGANVSFAISNVQNPTTVGTFYARIYTFNNSSNVSGAVSAGGVATTNVTDAGGVALSTAQQITITAKVQEQLTFCVGTTTVPTSGTAATAQTSCGSLSGSTVSLGNSNGVLSSSGPYVDVSTQYIVGTNATGGAAVVLKGPTLTSGSSTIAAIGSTATTSSAGTSQFGLCTYSGSGTNLVFSNETGGASGAYDDSNCNTTTQSATYGSTGGAGTAKFGFNTTATTAAAGDPLAKENAGSNSTGILPIIGNISTTQTAGIYTTTLSLIATGTY